MNSREAWAWSTVLRSLIEDHPRTAQEWGGLADSIDYLNERAYKAHQRAGDTQMAQCICMLPAWATVRIEDLLRSALAANA